MQFSTPIDSRNRGSSGVFTQPRPTADINQQTLQALSKLDFTDKGESFVEQTFVTLLLECLFATG
ncbi:hypothetical protein CP49_04550 [Bradyrhizobium valentinum]|uniref:Uncharacterized protein n=1 Tax=Bradyrhizobium valentinum TaxID=1518501 RepID=A0A0R3L394_9BRAD|nr:hypothetical protein CP49_04550 [Bradyrhizobium valentinum]